MGRLFWVEFWVTAFVIIPFYAIITGAMGALAGVAVMRMPAPGRPTAEL